MGYFIENYVIRVFVKLCRNIIWLSRIIRGIYLYLYYNLDILPDYHIT